MEILSKTHARHLVEWSRDKPEVYLLSAEMEFTTDGPCVNTLEGWKEMRVGIFSKRESGKGAAPQEWASRHLPHPRVSQAVTDGAVDWKRPGGGGLQKSDRGEAEANRSKVEA